MPDTITLARPYAKALFEHALANKKLSQWSEILQNLTACIMDAEAKRFITNPAVTDLQQKELLMTPFERAENQEFSAIENFISTLISNKRLLLLPDINVLFEGLRAEQEKTVVVNVRSFSKLSTQQEEALRASLNQRLKREVTLKVLIDTSLLGGALIQAGDLVIDGSVRGQLDKLSTELAA